MTGEIDTQQIAEAFFTSSSRCVQCINLTVLTEPPAYIALRENMRTEHNADPPLPGMQIQKTPVLEGKPAGTLDERVRANAATAAPHIQPLGALAAQDLIARIQHQD